MLQIAAYRGIGLVSDIIRLLTYSQYSHLAVFFTENMEVESCGKLHCIAAGSVIEAWKGGVRLANSLSENHTPGTKVDLFAFNPPLTAEQERRLAAFLLTQLGKPYDYINVLRFVPIVRLLIPGAAPGIWTRTHVFCSELVMEGCAAAGRHLLERCKPSEVPPRDPPRSPLLYLANGVVTQIGGWKSEVERHGKTCPHCGLSGQEPSSMKCDDCGRNF
jgi:hypothetical protein